MRHGSGGGEEYCYSGEVGVGGGKDRITEADT